MVLKGWDGCCLRNVHDRREEEYEEAAAVFVVLVGIEAVPNTNDAWQDFLSGYLHGVKWPTFSAN